MLSFDATTGTFLGRSCCSEDFPIKRLGPGSFDSGFASVDVRSLGNVVVVLFAALDSKNEFTLFVLASLVSTFLTEGFECGFEIGVALISGLEDLAVIVIEGCCTIFKLLA